MFELRLLCTEDELEALASALDDAGAASVSIEDADAGTDAEQGLFGEPGGVESSAAQAWPRSRISALFAMRQDIDAAARALATDPVVEVIGVFPLPQQDWVRVTQSQFEPVEIANGFWIVATWHERPPAAERMIRLDPGLAFGTGTHPTTRMCLRHIAGHAGRFRRVLDYGVGSGLRARLRQFCTLRASKRSPLKAILRTGWVCCLRYVLTSIQRITPSDVRMTSMTG